MKIKNSQSYFIDVRVVDGKQYYSYSADVMISPEEVDACDEAELFVKPNERINISRKAWKLAALRYHPDTESEVAEIISYSKGEKIRLGFVEIFLALSYG